MNVDSKSGSCYILCPLQFSYVFCLIILKVKSVHFSEKCYIKLTFESFSKEVSLNTLIEVICQIKTKYRSSKKSFYTYRWPPVKINHFLWKKKLVCGPISLKIWWACMNLNLKVIFQVATDNFLGLFSIKFNGIKEF